MTWMTVALTLVLPLLIRGCEVARIGDYIDVPLQKNGDSWTATVGVKPNHNDAWQLNLDLSVNSKHRTTYVMKLTLIHISDGLIRLKGPIGNEDFTGDDSLLVLKNQFLNLTVTVSQHELKLETETKDETAIHGLESLSDIETSTLGLRNIKATENFNLSFSCVEVNARTGSTSEYTFHPTVTDTASTLEYAAQVTCAGCRPLVIAAASVGALVVLIAPILVYCVFRRLRRRSPGDEATASCSAQYEIPRSVHAHAQRDNGSVHALYEDTCANVATPLQGRGITLVTRASSPQMSMDCEHECQSSSGENIYESVTDIEVSSDNQSCRNSIYQ
ncbi:uncharacterized protein LOC122257068 [Penaeus japonicus]|uniref:uncharacterized protein LOC122257068 n=1 Tax=Penaeus japonicus TaxID=27405 RepID=UPI001C70CDBD|nr:uncharacterized protein LOC122257068 [Penaeus japonicus]